MNWGRHVVVRAAIEFAARLALAHTAPLLEEEPHLGAPALIADRSDPLPSHRSRAGTALAADNDPVDVAQVDASNILKQRFDRQEPNGSGRCTQMLDPRQTVLAVLDTHAPPDVRKVGCMAQPRPQQIAQPL